MDKSPSSVASIDHQLFNRENPIVEMRPLIGKEQLRNNNMVTQGTGALDRDEQFASEYDPMLQSKKGSVGRETPFSLSPWIKPG